jgi:thiol-disulfide isomerase/thioredoxin
MNSLVHTIGYPGGNYAITYGKISGGNNKDLNYARMRISPGNSGGPLLNEKDEVVGIAQAVDAPISSNNSYFGGWGITKEALYEAKKITSNTSKSSDVEYKADVVIFTADWCPSCKVLEREMPVSYFNEKGLRVLKVKSKSGKWSDPDLVKEFKSKTGTDVPGLPTVWARGTDKYQTGYSSGRRLSLFGFLMSGFRAIGVVLFGNGPSGEILPETAPPPPGPQVPSVPDEYGDIDLPPPAAPSDEPPAPTEEVINWENVSIIIAAKQTALSYVRSKAAAIALKAIKGPLERANSEIFEGKANLFFVDQRTQPNRYASFSQAAGVDPDPFYIIVLVQKQSLGLKSLIAGRVERSIEGKIPEGTPVEIIFERIHKGSYVAITESLTVADQTPEEKEVSLKDAIVSELKGDLGDLKGNLAGIVIPSKDEITGTVIKNLGPAIAELQKSQDEDEEERSIFQRLIAGLLALIGASHATGGIRGFLANRAMKKLGLKTGEKPKKPELKPAPQE